MSFQRLSPILAQLVDDRVGIIGRVTESARSFGVPNLHYFYATACNTLSFCSQRNCFEGSGASTDKQVALARAIGEGIERYCSAIYEREELPLSAYASASFPCVVPSDFALYAPQQYSSDDFPFRPFCDDTPVRWVPGIRLPSRSQCYLPASMVYLPYVVNTAEEEVPIVQSISTGLACHCSFYEAAVSAVCEVIERDAVMISWQGRLSRSQVDLQTLPDSLRDLANRYEQVGCSVSLFDITMDHGVPTILTVLRSRLSDLPALLIAAAAHLDAEQAARKSLEELALAFRWGVHLKRQREPVSCVGGYRNIIEPADHLRFYCDDINAQLADFLYSSKERVDFGAIPRLATGEAGLDLQLLVEKIGQVGHEIFLADLTTPDIKDLGLHVVRAVIPGFHPLFFGYNLRALGGTRLWTVPQKLGYRGITPDSGDNPIPHPYP